MSMKKLLLIEETGSHDVRQIQAESSEIGMYIECSLSDAEEFDLISIWLGYFQNIAYTQCNDLLICCIVFTKDRLFLFL